MAQVKPEIKVEDTKHIGDVDEFEEDTDLQIPKGGNAWLLKVSEDMWKTWSEIHKNAAEGEQVTVGHLRVFHAPQKNGKQKIQIRLDDALPQQKSIPKMYNLDLKSDCYNNTVIFSEKDLPGHNSNVRPNRPPPGQRPGGINKFDRYNNQQPRKPGSYRTAIPKQTALAPKVVNEADMHPVEDKTSLDHFAKTYQAALHAGKKTQIVTDARIKHPGTDRDSFKFGTLTSKVGAGNRKKPVKEKAVRMEKAALLDALKNCFKEYAYWSLKALRQRLRQPEAYIKETLDDIATLMRQGDFVQTYKLKQEYRALLDEEGVVIKDESAVAKMETTDEGTGDEMDEDEEFEDVKME